MVEGLVILDLEGRVVVYNPAAESLLDLPPGTLHVGAELPIEPVLELMREADRDALPIVHEHCVTLDSGRIVALQATRLPASAGGQPSVLVTIRDGRAAEQLAAMRRAFVANVAHEVRTPLSAIRACSATLLGGALGDGSRARHFVEMIDHNAARLAQLIDDLGRLSDLEQGDVEIDRQPIAVAPLLRGAAETCRERALSAGVAIDLSVADGTAPVRADAELLRQALVMLIDNGVRYTPRGGRIAVSAASSDDGWVSLCVRDTGKGVRSDDVPRLSERFYRPDTGRSRDRGGSGLGLALVKHIARAHGASLHIESELDRGTAVTLRWPAAAEGAAAEHDRAAAQ